MVFDILYALWTWKNNINNANLHRKHHPCPAWSLICRDSSMITIRPKDGDWGAFPLDPIATPGYAEYIIGQLTKPKAINAKFLKIDFLQPAPWNRLPQFKWPCYVSSGLQAYNYAHAAMSIYAIHLRPDIFISQAISPFVPASVWHTRFLSTDVYSHLRNDAARFSALCAPNSRLLISATPHFWWTKGSLCLKHSIWLMWW